MSTLHIKIKLKVTQDTFLIIIPTDGNDFRLGKQFEIFHFKNNMEK